MKPGNISQQIIESVSGNTTGSIHVDPIKTFHDLRMVWDLKFRDGCLTESLNFHIAGVIRSDRYRFIDHLRDDHHDLLDLFCQSAFFFFQFRQPSCILLDLLLQGICFFQFGRILLSLTHQHAYLF